MSSCAPSYCPFHGLGRLFLAKVRTCMKSKMHSQFTKNANLTVVSLQALYISRSFIKPSLLLTSLFTSLASFLLPPVSCCSSPATSPRDSPHLRLLPVLLSYRSTISTQSTLIRHSEKRRRINMLGLVFGDTFSNEDKHGPYLRFSSLCCAAGLKWLDGL